MTLPNGPSLHHKYHLQLKTAEAVVVESVTEGDQENTVTKGMAAMQIEVP